MSEELRAAAEHIRKIQGSHLFTNTEDIGKGAGMPWKLWWENKLLVQAYLREHPADDDAAVDIPWLESIGFRKWELEPDVDEDYREYDVWIPMHDDTGWACRLAYAGGSIYAIRMGDPEVFEGIAESVQLIGNRGTIHHATRWQARQLFKALGITLKETK